MKTKTLLLVLSCLLLFSVAGQMQATATAFAQRIDAEPTAPFESSIDLAVAADFFAKTQAIWDEDGGKLWGFPLHAPLMFADPVTRHAVTNMPDPGGVLQKQGSVYVGVLPDNVFISATAANFSGLRWGMVPWYWMDLERLDNETIILRLLTHEAFHAIQSQIISGNHPGTPRLEHVNNLDARISIILEMNALMTAARGSGDLRIAAIKDALSIRKDRRERFPGVDKTEIIIELDEGLAVFTDLMLVRRDMDEILSILEGQIRAFDNTSLTIFGYQSGALYGLILDKVGADWKNGITYSTDLGNLLQQHLGITELTPFEQLNLEPYGYSRIVPVQRAWVENFENRRAGAREALLNQPTLFLVTDHTENSEIREFEFFLLPTDGTPMGHLLVSYGHLTVNSVNWSLRLRGGYMHRVFRPNGIWVGSAIDIEVSEDKSRAVSPTWELIITDDNYTIETLPDGLIEIVRK